MSLKITRDITGLKFMIHLQGMRKKFMAKNLDEVAAATAHYFRGGLTQIHQEYKNKGLCPLCRDS